MNLYDYDKKKNNLVMKCHISFCTTDERLFVFWKIYIYIYLFQFDLFTIPVFVVSSALAGVSCFLCSGSVSIRCTLLHRQGEQSVLHSIRVRLRLRALPANKAVWSLSKWNKFTEEAVSVQTPHTMFFFQLMNIMMQIIEILPWDVW